ncbi:MAG: hypothetical protein R3331_10050 [Sulfurospirillaceae bacterium]|nr:hypothetical protein [Sulfurospirillaceae bacterium]
MKWLNDLKIAIIEENIENINKSIMELPNFQDIDKAKEALSLLEEAIKVVSKEKDKVLKTMNKIQKTKEFLKN